MSDKGNTHEKVLEKKEDLVTIITIINTNTNKLYTKCNPHLLINADCIKHDLVDINHKESDIT